MAGATGRRWVRLWHRGFGLVVGPWIALLGLSGAAIAFYDDLDAGVNADWRRVPAQARGAPIAVDTAQAQIAAVLPGFQARMIDLPNAPREPIVTIGSALDGAGERMAVEAFSHPASGALLGWRDSERRGLDRRHLMPTLYALHVELLAGETVAWLMGFIALLWLFDHGPALWLAVPRLSAFAAAWRISRKGRLRLLYDLHRAPGLWLAPLTLLFAVTGLCLSWPEETRALVRHMSPVGDRLHYAMPDRALPAANAKLSPGVVLARQERRGQIDMIVPLPAKALYALRRFDPRDPDDMGRLWTYVSARDGQRVAQRHDMGESAGDAFFGWQYPLHSGRALGAGGRLVVAVVGLACAGLWLTGLLLWLRRRRSSPRRS